MAEEFIPPVQDLSSYLSIFNPQTLHKKGLCPVTQIQHNKPSTQTLLQPQHSLYYEIHGTGPEKILFIMGLNASSFSWLHQVDHFTTPGKALDPSRYSVLVFDNRGVGNSEAPKGPYTTHSMASDVVTLLDYVGWTKPREIHLIAVSLGGMIALELSTMIPDRLATLVLSVTTAGSNPWSNLPTWQGMNFLARIMFAKDTEVRIPYLLNMVFPKKWLDAMSTDYGRPGKTNYEVQSENLRKRISVTRAQTLVAGLSQMAAGLTHRVTPDRLAQISRSIPRVLILTGDDDKLVHPSNSFFLKSHMPEAELIQWEETGHAVHLQHLIRFNKLMEKTIDEGRAAAEAEVLSATSQ